VACQHGERGCLAATIGLLVRQYIRALAEDEASRIDATERSLAERFARLGAYAGILAKLERLHVGAKPPHACRQDT